MSEREPTRDELLAMAYVDGELPFEERAAFEARLSSEPALLREVGQLQRLNVLARQVTPREPKDFAWHRLQRLHGHGTLLGLFASVVGTIGMLAYCLSELFLSDLALLPKFFLALIVTGLAVVFLMILRARLQTLPYDPYTEIER